MAASGESRTLGSGGSTEDAFLTFYSEVTQIEKRDLVPSSKNQIERQTCPGSSYFSLNPFEVLQKFRQLSTLVCPDKNHDADRAQRAFEAMDKAYKLLLDQDQKKRAENEYMEHDRAQVKKTNKEGKPKFVEDDPELFKQAVCKQTKSLEEEIEAQEEAKREREWQKNFEESGDGHVDSWRNFQANTKRKKEKKNQTFLRPLKVKMKQRE
uniref:J domain-containing protein n=1 Tax=Rhinopithecus bieti TaxID=61621 RepID=A0A2K6KJ16_RHIBE